MSASRFDTPTATIRPPRKLHLWKRRRSLHLDNAWGRRTCEATVPAPRADRRGGPRHFGDPRDPAAPTQPPIPLHPIRARCSPTDLEVCICPPREHAPLGVDPLAIRKPARRHGCARSAGERLAPRPTCGPFPPLRAACKPHRRTQWNSSGGLKLPLERIWLEARPRTPTTPFTTRRTGARLPAGQRRSASTMGYI